MRVLYIATAYPRSETDVITPWLVETVNRLRAGGTDVTVFTSSYRGLGNQTISGAPVVRFRYFPKRWEDLTHDETAIDRVKRGIKYKFMALCYLAGGVLGTWRLCRRQRFDIIHVHWPLPHSLFGWVASRVCRAPVVISFHGAEVRAVSQGMKPLRPFLRWAIRNAGAVTANSSHTVRAIQDVYNRPVTIVPYGTTAGEAEPKGREEGIEGSRDRVENTAGKSRAELLFAGRLVERKGVKYLVEATATLARDLPVHLNIVGTGPEEPALRAQVEQLGIGRHVTFHGFLSSAAFEDQYRNCDAFILPAVIDAKGDTEGLGVVLIDAMSHRRPVVASGVGGIVDLVLDGKTGLSVPPADPVALAEALRRILTDPELARRLGDGGFDHIQRNYSWPAIICRLEGIYQRMLAPAPAQP